MTDFKVVLSPDAEKHLEDIEIYLADRFYPARARRFIQKLLASCNSLNIAPDRGAKRDDLAPGIRMVGFNRRAAIYFKVVEDEVMIIGIFYGGRQNDGKRGDKKPFAPRATD